MVNISNGNISEGSMELSLDDLGKVSGGTVEEAEVYLKTLEEKYGAKTRMDLLIMTGEESETWGALVHRKPGQG